MKQFVTAARRGAAAVDNPIDVPFMFDDTEMIAHAPTSGQIALYMAKQSEGGAGSFRALFDFMAAVLSQPHYDQIEKALHEGLDLMVLVEIVNYCMEEWSARPTTSVPASSPSLTNTGPPSTERPLSAVGTFSV